LKLLLFFLIIIIETIYNIYKNILLHIIIMMQITKKQIIDEIKRFNNASIKYYMEPKYKDIIINNLNKKFIDFFNDNETKEQNKNIIIKSLNDYLFDEFIPRSYIDNRIIYPLTDSKREIIKQKIKIIEDKDKSNPAQRTPDWYHQRFNLLSASNIYKALGSQANKNSLIYEKCKPIDTEKYNRVNINSAMHWGQKYEPVAQMYYEYRYDAIINEYGCIPHSKYKFLGASPDGINVKYDSDRYGRLVEIKSVVSRKITGIPKKDYWVQTQLQMECNDLDECDFLECCFKEYDSYDDFINDGDFNTTTEGNHKGIIMCFFKDNKPHYEYSPYQCSKEDYELWEQKMMSQNNDKLWVSNNYWYLKTVSCVLIPRNREWFNCVVGEFEDLWNTILYDRIHGYDHRKPNKRITNKQEPPKTKVIKSDNTINDLLLNDLYNNKELLEAETSGYLKEKETIEGLKEKETIDRLKEKETIDRLKEKETIDRLKEAENIDRLKEAENIESLKEAENIESYNGEKSEINTTKKINLDIFSYKNKEQEQDKEIIKITKLNKEKQETLNRKNRKNEDIIDFSHLI
jgi:putative phage-type endonuclease